MVTKHDQAAVRAALQILAQNAGALIPQLEAAIAANDAKTAQVLSEEFLSLVEKMIPLRIELGEGEELLQFVNRFAIARGIDISSLVGSGKPS